MKRLNKLDDNPFSMGIAYLVSRIGGPVGVVGGVIMFIAGLVLLPSGTQDAYALLALGVLWEIIGLVVLPPRWRRRLFHKNPDGRPPRSRR